MWRPLCSLAGALAGPQNLIKKRLDKLLDFERVEEKLLEAGSVTYEEQEARHTYQALNSLLVAELPQLNRLALRWLRQILHTFVDLQRELAERVLQRAEGSLAQVRPLAPGRLWRLSRQGLRAPFRRPFTGARMGRDSAFQTGRRVLSGGPWGPSGSL